MLRDVIEQVFENGKTKRRRNLPAGVTKVRRIRANPREVVVRLNTPLDKTLLTAVGVDLGYKVDHISDTELAFYRVEPVGSGGVHQYLVAVLHTGTRDIHLGLGLDRGNSALVAIIEEYLERLNGS